jgi:hypothetical protein
MLGKGKTRQQMRSSAHIQKQKDDIQREPSLSEPHQAELSPSLANGADSLAQMTPTAEPASQSKPLQRQTMPQTMISYASGTPTPIQTKLRVGAANDRYEQEADQVADQVVGQESSVKSQEADGIQREPTVSPIQRDGGEAGFETNQEFDSNLSRANSGGSPLPDTIRREFEPKMGTDLSQVRVHTGPDSASLNNQIQAKAFTHGRDIHFNAGQYQPNTVQGKRLLAHEVTHTVQQGGVQTNGQKINRMPNSNIQRSWAGFKAGVKKHLWDKPKKFARKQLIKLTEADKFKKENSELKIIMKHSPKAFGKFSKKEFSAENNSAYAAIQRYKKNPSWETGMSIYGHFFNGRESPQEININTSTCDTILTKLQQYHQDMMTYEQNKQNNSELEPPVLDPDLFDKAEKAVMVNLADTYSRFRLKDEGREAVEHAKLMNLDIKAKVKSDIKTVLEGRKEEEDYDPTFDETLADFSLFDAFYAYAKGEMSTENFDCWKAIQQYKAKPSRSKAIKIYDTYLAPDADLEINTTQPIKDAIKTEVDDYRTQKGNQTFLDRLKRDWVGRYTGRLGRKDLFQELETVCTLNMSDTFDRYKFTEAYKIVGRMYKAGTL